MNKKTSTSDNPVGDLMDAAVSILTDLARTPMTFPLGQQEPLDFADRLGCIMTHVAANLGGIDQLLIASSPAQAELVRRLIARTTEPQDFVSWRTIPIFVPPLDLEDALVTDLAPFDQVMAEIHSTYAVAWARAAAAAGLPAETVPAIPTFWSWATARDHAKSPIVNDPIVLEIRRDLETMHIARHTALTQYAQDLLDAMNTHAYELGYNAPVAYATHPRDIATTDLELSQTLTTAALTTTPHPRLIAPTL